MMQACQEQIVQRLITMCGRELLNRLGFNQHAAGDEHVHKIIFDETLVHDSDPDFELRWSDSERYAPRGDFTLEQGLIQKSAEFVMDVEHYAHNAPVDRMEFLLAIDVDLGFDMNWHVRRLQ